MIIFLRKDKNYPVIVEVKVLSNINPCPAEPILSYQGLRFTILTSKGRYDETFAGEDD